MLHLDEIKEAIAEIECQRDHSVKDLQTLSALYSIQDHAFGQDETYQRGYSLAAAPTPKQEDALDQYGDSDFLLVVAGKMPSDAWRVMDDLMSTLRLSFPKAYDRVMRQMRQL